MIKVAELTLKVPNLKFLEVNLMSIFSELANAINTFSKGFNEGFNSANQKIKGGSELNEEQISDWDKINDYYNKKIEKLKVRYEEMLECGNDDCFIKRSAILNEINKLQQLRDKELSEYNAKSFAKFNLGQ